MQKRDYRINTQTNFIWPETCSYPLRYGSLAYKVALSQYNELSNNKNQNKKNKD